jgi:uncharacterized damage-inducible protein DinB
MIDWPDGDTTRREGCSMSEPVREMFQYHTWATLALLDHCAALPSETQKLSTAGTYGTIHDTFAHLIYVDGEFLSLMNSDADAAHVGGLALDRMREHFVMMSERWTNVLDHLDEYDPTIPTNKSRPDLPHVRDLLLLLAIYHGVEHRAQICSILGANELDVPDLTGWKYWFMTREIPLDG